MRKDCRLCCIILEEAESNLEETFKTKVETLSHFSSKYTRLLLHFHVISEATNVSQKLSLPLYHVPGNHKRIIMCVCMCIFSVIPCSSYLIVGLSTLILGPPTYFLRKSLRYIPAAHHLLTRTLIHSHTISLSLLHRVIIELPGW